MLMLDEAPAIRATVVGAGAGDAVRGLPRACAFGVIGENNRVRGDPGKRGCAQGHVVPARHVIDRVEDGVTGHNAHRRRKHHHAVFCHPGAKAWCTLQPEAALYFPEVRLVHASLSRNLRFAEPVSVHPCDGPVLRDEASSVTDTNDPRIGRCKVEDLRQLLKCAGGEIRYGLDQ